MTYFVGETGHVNISSSYMAFYSCRKLSCGAEFFFILVHLTPIQFIEAMQNSVWATEYDLSLGNIAVVLASKPNKTPLFEEVIKGLLD